MCPPSPSCPPSPTSAAHTTHFHIPFSPELCEPPLSPGPPLASDASWPVSVPPSSSSPLSFPPCPPHHLLPAAHPRFLPYSQLS
eukprot:13114_6